MKGKQQFDRAAALEKLAALFTRTDSEAEITRAVGEYLRELRAWRRQTAPDAGIVQRHPHVTDAP